MLKFTYAQLLVIFAAIGLHLVGTAEHAGGASQAREPQGTPNLGRLRSAH
jgi:hypothetical protein